MQKTKNKIRSILKTGFISLGILSLFLSIPLSVNAVANDPASDPNFQLAPTKGSCDRNPVTNAEECGWNDFLKLISRLMQYLIFISASIAVLMFAYAGFLMLTAFGDSGKVEQGHKIFSTTITGVVIIMLAWLIIATILKILQVGPDFTILQGVDSVQTSSK